jgi:hypothetical protein
MRKLIGCLLVLFPFWAMFSVEIYQTGSARVLVIIPSAILLFAAAIACVVGGIRLLATPSKQ